MKGFNIESEGREQINKIIIDNKFIEQIDTIIMTFRNKVKTLTPDEISRAALELSLLLCNLGDLVAVLTSNSNEAYSYRKFRQAWEFSKLKVNLSLKGKDLENKSLTGVEFEYKQELINRFVSDYFKTYYDDISRIIMVAQSRLRIL
jgi:hypothetical protein